MNLVIDNQKQLHHEFNNYLNIQIDSFIADVSMCRQCSSSIGKGCVPFPPRPQLPTAVAVNKNVLFDCPCQKGLTKRA